MAGNHPMLPCLLDPSFGIPTDVTFQIMGLEDLDNQNGQEKEVMLGEVHGHKISASADGGPRSRVCARETLRSAPHRH